MNRKYYIVGIVLLLLPFFSLSQVQETKTCNLMGSVFQITLVAQDSSVAHKNIEKVITEIERIENLLSEWREATQIAQVNSNAGIKPITVAQEVIERTRKALFFSKITNGAFDISIVAMDKIWLFDGSMEKLPTKKEIKKATEKVGYRNIIIDSLENTVYLSKKGMKIGFGSIGKGYAADKARELMQSLGIKGGMINASGDIATWGTQLDGSSWRIGVNNPFETGDTLAILEFGSNKAVTTSGNYEKYAEINNQRYAHIINPLTGFPSTELTSVTIVGENAEMCNGFSTSLMVLGAKKGVELLKKFPEYQYLILTNEGIVISNFTVNKKD